MPTSHINTVIFSVESIDRLIVFVTGITGNTAAEDRACFLAAGADIVMTKPLDVAELLTYIQSRLCQMQSNIG